jgi:signal transduction histidine kinase
MKHFTIFLNSFSNDAPEYSALKRELIRLPENQLLIQEIGHAERDTPNLAILCGSVEKEPLRQYIDLLLAASVKPFILLVSSTISASEAVDAGVDFQIHPAEIGGINSLINAIQNKRMIEPSEAGFNSSFEQLKEKNSELEKINFELDRFVYSASHDLRSPLTSVLGLLYLLREELEEGDQLKYVALMEESILKLDNTIRDIVAYSRNNRTEIVLDSINLPAVISEIAANLNYLESEELKLSEIVFLDVSSSFISDKSRIQVILTNLIANSIKYRHISKKLSIHISARQDENHLILKVADNGMGINDTHIGKIFNMFYRTNEQSTGSGLGLYIVREMVKKLDGFIEVSSRINEGTEFTITLPLTEKLILTDQVNENN